MILKIKLQNQNVIDLRLLKEANVQHPRKEQKKLRNLNTSKEKKDFKKNNSENE